MKTLILQIQRLRREEAGLTLVEIMIAVALLGIIAVITLLPVIGGTEASVRFAEKEMGINQGDAMDTAREITDVAFIWVATHAETGLDTTFTKNDLVTFTECDRMAILGIPSIDCDTEPYLEPIPDNYVWGAGNRDGSLQNMCAVVYEVDPAADSKNARYTAENPALWERMAKNHTHLNACSYTDATGVVAYNFGEVSIDSPYKTKTQVFGGE